MDNNHEGNGFQYTYSAREQAELKRIREKYAPSTEAEDKMARLRRLDASVTQKAQIASLVLGVLGTLILGLGMSMCMTELGSILGVHRHLSMVVGVIIGVIGGILAALAYPAYNAVTKRERAKVAPEILRLTDELMK